MPVFRRFQAFLPILFLALGAGLLGAQVSVRIDLPGLINLPPGSETLTDILASQVALATQDIEPVVNASLDKPKLLGAFGEALSLSLLPLSQGPSWKGRYFSLTLASGAALVGDSYDIGLWTERFRTLAPDSDYRLGLGLQPFTGRLSISLDPLVRGLSVKASGGYLDYKLRGVGLKAWSAQGGLSWLALPPWSPVRGLAWRGLLVDLAYGYSSNSVTATLDLDTISRQSTFVPNPYLPLSYTVDLQVKPSFELAFATIAQALPLQLSTGFTFFDFLSLTLGGGASWTWGRSSIGLSGTQPIELGIVDSNLDADFIDPNKPGTITLSGEREGEPSAAWRWYAYGALEIRVGAIYFQAPLLAYCPGSGFSASLGMGLSL
jgi:hypothetical protein